MNLIIHEDNKHIYYQNKSLFEIYTEIVPISKPRYQNLEIIFILKGNIPNIIIENQHYCNYKLKNCNRFGKLNTIYVIYTKEADYNFIFSIIWDI